VSRRLPTTCRRCGAELVRREQAEGFCDRCLRSYTAPGTGQVPPPVGAEMAEDAELDDS
jgi:hypothetical protein